MNLVIVAHPDDESLFMGGQIATLRQAGERVVIVALSDGVGARFRWYQAWSRLDAASGRAEAFLAACRELDVEGRIERWFRDQRAADMGQLALNRQIHALLQRERPTQVYSHWIGDLNEDHRCVAEAVLVATRPGCQRYVQQVRAMAPEFPTRALTSWKPTVTVKLSDGMRAVKLRACYHYHREFRDYPHPRSWQALSDQRVEQFVEVR